MNQSHSITKYALLKRYTDLILINVFNSCMQTCQQLTEEHSQNNVATHKLIRIRPINNQSSSINTKMAGNFLTNITINMQNAMHYASYIIFRQSSQLTTSYKHRKQMKIKITNEHSKETMSTCITAYIYKLLDCSCKFQGNNLYN